MDKCEFGVFLDYLGHHVDTTEIKSIADKVQAIVNFPKPFNMQQLLHFTLQKVCLFFHRASPVLKNSEVVYPACCKRGQLGTY